MRIGSYQITGVSRRFWIIVAAVILVGFIAYQMWPKSDPGAALGLNPALTPNELQELSKEPSGWIGDYVAVYGLERPNSVDEISNSYVAMLGRPFRLRVFIPDESFSKETRPDLHFIARGYTFVPAAILDRNRTYNMDDMDQVADEQLSDGQPVQLAFPSDRLPAPGNSYEVTGLLDWRSDQVNVEASELVENAPSPTFVVDEYQKLSNDELRAPATHAVNLDFDYQEGPVDMNVRRLEWASGRELRACVTVTNTSSQPVSNWVQALQMKAESGGGEVPASLDEGSSGFSDTLPAFASRPVDLVFDGTVADPQQDLILRMDALRMSLGDRNLTNTVQVLIDSDQIERINDDDTLSRSCSAGERDQDGGEQVGGQPIEPHKRPAAKRSTPGAGSPASDLLGE